LHWTSKIANFTMPKSTTQTTWEAAVAAVAAGMSLRETKRRYKLPSTDSLHRRCRGTTPMDATPGRRPKYLSTAAELGVVESITFRAKRGKCFDMAQLQLLLREVALTLNQAPASIPDEFPNARWTQRFVKRHPSVSIRQAQVLDQKRYDRSTVPVVENYYKELALRMQERGYTPDCIYNADESGMNPQGTKAPRVICPKGLRANTCQSSDRENVSVMGCCSAAGWAMAPMYLFAGKNRKVSWLEGTVPGSSLAMTESGMIQRPVFFAWLVGFIEDTAAIREQGNKPALLLLDGHFSHIGLDIIRLADNNNIGTIRAHIVCAVRYPEVGLYLLAISG